MEMTLEDENDLQLRANWKLQQRVLGKITLQFIWGRRAPYALKLLKSILSDAARRAKDVRRPG